MHLLGGASTGQSLKFKRLEAARKAAPATRGLQASPSTDMGGVTTLDYIGSANGGEWKQSKPALCVHLWWLCVVQAVRLIVGNALLKVNEAMLRSHLER